MGDLESSLLDFNKAAELDPMNSIIFSNWGLVLWKLEWFWDAIADYTKEISLGGKKPRTWALNNRAYCYAKLGEFEKAIKDYTEVIEKEDN